MDITGADISYLQEQMEKGHLCSKDLTIACLKRIQAFDRNGPKINSVAELNPDAIFIAESLDRERSLHGPRSRLHGIPVLLKDNISTGDKMHTTAGSVALDDNFARMDAPLVKKLRKAGAVILGKSNLSEFARYIALEFPDGYSSRAGQVKNPYDSSFPVSGSSSGSAAAVASGFCSVAVGTETAGSIIYPSIFSGICGLKPTVGLISRSGIIPICGQDTAGPMARTVTDCAILLGEMLTGEDPEDPATICTDHLAYKDYTKFLKLEDFYGMRIGVNRVSSDSDTFPDDSMEIFERELTLMRSAGVELVDCDIPFTGLKKGILGQATMLYEFKSAINDYLSRYATGRCRSLEDIITYNQMHKEIALRYGQDLLLLAQEQTSGRLIEEEYWLQKFEAIEKGQKAIDENLRKLQLDVLISPCYSNLPAITGYPSMVVPMGLSGKGIPVGLSFYAGAFQEGKILTAAYGYEQISKHQSCPVFHKYDEKKMQKGVLDNE